jgi:hypothetical protein
LQVEKTAFKAYVARDTEEKTPPRHLPPLDPKEKSAGRISADPFMDLDFIIKSQTAS